MVYESFTIYDINGNVLAHKEAMNSINYISEELYVHKYVFTLNDSEPYSIEVQLANQNDICVLNDTIRY